MTIDQITDRSMAEAAALSAALDHILPSAAVASDDVIRAVLLEDCRLCGEPVPAWRTRYCSDVCAVAECGPQDDEDEPHDREED